MYLDAQYLNKFYETTKLGSIVKKTINSGIESFWSDNKNQNIVGYGFPSPLIDSLAGRERRVTLLMPGGQGVVGCPNGKENVSVLCEDSLWPLPPGETDKLVILHGLEVSEKVTALLNECWRILAPNGKMLCVVPNRTGLWCRNEISPFGFGRPYTLHQLESLLLGHGFLPGKHKGSLFSIPSQKLFWLRMSYAFERVGWRILPYYAGGILMLEATKQISTPKRVYKKINLRVSLGALSPRPASSSTALPKIKTNKEVF
jgi:hypothetical protein